MYLRSDKTGHASGIEYGKQGQEVEVILTRENMSVVRNGDKVFWIHTDMLSEEKIEPNKPIIKNEKAKTRTSKRI